MTVRLRASRALLTLLPVFLVLGSVVATGASAAGFRVTPADVLADKGSARSKRSFFERIARIGAIMGPELNRGPRLRIPEKPAWTKPRQRDADALAGTR